MNIGMLWFDNDPKANLELKVERAVVYYRNKYGRSPNVCFVHPTMLPSNADNKPETSAEAARYIASGVEVRSNRSVLPNHLWIGVHSLG